MYVISIAAELAGVHPQTLRVYERKGLLAPRRTQGNSRRYSERDIEVLRRIQELTNEGLNLAGVLRVMELEADLASLRRGYEAVQAQLVALQEQVQHMIEGQGAASLVPFKDVRRIRRALKVDLIEQAATRRHFIAPPIPEND